MKISFTIKHTGERVTSLPVIRCEDSHVAGVNWITVDQGHTVKCFTTYEPYNENRPFRIDRINTVYRSDIIESVVLDPPYEDTIIYNTGDQIWYHTVNGKMVVTKIHTSDGIVWELGKGYTKASLESTTL